MIQTFIPDGFDAQREYAHIKQTLQSAFGAGGGAVVGMSGGKDSSVVAKLFCDAVGPEKVLGVIMPNGVMKDEKIAEDICNFLTIRHYTVDISGVYQAELAALSRVADIPQAARVNILPRIRMTTLYALAQSMGLRVAGTGNLSESTVGYCTKWGDMASDFNPIARYTCSEVIEIGRLLLPGWIIEKVPEDGLWGRTDEDNLGFTYYELDRFLRAGDRLDNIEAIRRRIESSRHKRTPIPHVLPLFPGEAYVDIRP